MAEPRRSGLTPAEVEMLRLLAEGDEFRTLAGLARAIGLRESTLHRAVYEEGRRPYRHTVRKVREFLAEREGASARRRSSARRRAGVRASL